MLSRLNPVAIIALVIGLAFGFGAGSFLAGQRARVAVLSGPLSDNYGPALSAIVDAKTRLQAGDTNILEQLRTVETHLGAANEWSRRFVEKTQ